MWTFVSMTPLSWLQIIEFTPTSKQVQHYEIHKCVYVAASKKYLKMHNELATPKIDFSDIKETEKNN